MEREARGGSDVGEAVSGANYLVPITPNPKWLLGLLSSPKGRRTTKLKSKKCEALKHEKATVEKAVLLHLTRKKSVSMSDDVTGDAVRSVTMRTVFVLVYCVFMDRKFEEFHTMCQMCVFTQSMTHFMKLLFIVTRKLVVKKIPYA